MTIEVVKLDTSGMDEAIRRAGTDGQKLMDALAELFVGNVRESFNTSPDGRTYKRGKDGVHVASQPGYPPNIDSGNYTNSLRWENSGSFGRSVYGAEYGLYLEDSSVLNRPHLNPAMERLEEQLPSVAPQYIKLG